MGIRKRYRQGKGMARLKVKEIAEAQGVIMFHIARRTSLTIGQVRRYWYSTANGKEDGPPLGKIDLDALQIIADLLKVEPGDLVERSPLINAATPATE